MFRYWSWFETIRKQQKCLSRSLKRQCTHLALFNLSGCHWLKFPNQLGIKQALVVENVIWSAIVFWPLWFPAICPSILDSKRNSCVPNFFLWADFLLTFTPKSHNASHVIRSNWKPLNLKCKVEYLFSSQAL